MSKIDPKELKMAMREAARMREANEDPYYLASSLLVQSFRIRQLENIANLAEQLLKVLRSRTRDDVVSSRTQSILSVDVFSCRLTELR